MGLLKDFAQFLEEYKVTTLAIAFVIGVTSTSLIKSLVENIIMPVISPLTSTGWENTTFNLGPIAIKWGAFLSEIINFTLIVLIIFIIVKKVLRLKQKES